MNANGRVELKLEDRNFTASSTADEMRVFYARVRSTMIRRAIEGHFDTKTMDVIRLQRKDYEWRDSQTGMIEQDGATMLKILVDHMKPSVRSGLKEFKTILQQAEANKFENKVVKLINAMESAYDEITVNQGASYDSFMDDVFRALRTFPNKIFSDYVIRLQYNYESQPSSKMTDKKIGDMTRLIKNRYNNMVHNKSWDYVDPSKKRIMALSTSLAEVKQQLLEEKTRNSSSESIGNDRKKLF